MTDVATTDTGLVVAPDGDSASFPRGPFPWLCMGCGWALPDTESAQVHANNFGHDLRPEPNGGPSADGQAFAIDAAHIDRQRAWGDRTFGPGQRTAGVIEHIGKELLEVAAAPDDAVEWADVIILAIDGATRRGITAQELLDAVRAKQVRNESRTWPDWRTQPADRAIEHIRDEDEDGAES